MPLDRLPPTDAAALVALRKDADLCAVLLPLRPGKTIKAVCARSAALIALLRAPRRLPHDVLTELGDELPAIVGKLVLDSVLEIRDRDDPSLFLSGSTAGKLFEPAAGVSRYGSRIERLSVQALQYAQLLECDDILLLSSYLYAFQRVPAGPRIASRLSTVRDVARFLGIDNGNDRRVHGDEWTRVTVSEDRGGWHFFSRRGRRVAASPYKLYVSPAWDRMPDVLATVLRVAGRNEVNALKTGRDLYGLLRPDKLVVYCPTSAALWLVAEELLAALRDIPAHGVPFTAAIDPDGLLSWGMDPPRSHARIGGQSASWRRWVTDRLASALAAARLGPRASDEEPWQFALKRLSLDGVDVSSWMLTTVRWSG